MAGYRAQAGDREHRTPMAWQHRDHISSDGHSHRSVDTSNQMMDNRNPLFNFV